MPYNWFENKKRLTIEFKEIFAGDNSSKLLNYFC